MATIINNTTSGDAQFVLDPDFSIYSKNFSGISGKYAKVDSSGWMSDTWFFGLVSLRIECWLIGLIIFG